MDRAQAMVFLVTPESVRAGSYTLTELGRRRLDAMAREFSAVAAAMEEILKGES